MIDLLERLHAVLVGGTWRHGAMVHRTCFDVSVHGGGADRHVVASTAGIYDEDDADLNPEDFSVV
jgi:hypothetical protein